MRRRSEAQSGRYGRGDYRWVSDWKSVQSGLITCWNMYGSINVKIVLQYYYAGTRSLYIQEGRQNKGRKPAPPPRAGARGLCHARTLPHLRTPPLVSHVRTPPHLRTPPYSDSIVADGQWPEAILLHPVVRRPEESCYHSHPRH